MRARKKQWGDALFAVHRDDFMAAPEPGKWSETLKVNEIHVELGCGKGDYWLGMADLYPNQGWIAFERNPTVAAIALKKAIERGVNSERLRLYCTDAQGLGEYFSPGEIDVLHLNFSDPWPKTRHHKRRLVAAKMLDVYQPLLSPQGRIIQKTDNVDLFNDSLVEMCRYFDLIEVDVDYRRQSHDEDVITEYEQRFMDLKQPIFRAVYQKRRD